MIYGDSFAQGLLERVVEYVGKDATVIGFCSCLYTTGMLLCGDCGTTDPSFPSFTAKKRL